MADWQEALKKIENSPPPTVKLGTQTSQNAPGRTQQPKLVQNHSGTVKRTPVRQDVRPNDSTTVRTPKRIKVRYAFEFYQDQIARLKEMKKMAYINDDDFNMSEVIRKAIDKYLEEGTTVRQTERPYGKPVKR
jgi:hypothetical protein